MLCGGSPVQQRAEFQTGAAAAPPRCRQSLVNELLAEFRTVEYAFLHIGETHEWHLFDTAASGVGSHPMPSGSRQPKGHHVPRRGHALLISKTEVLLTVSGSYDVKRPTDGLPQPLLLKLHRASTFTDVEYLAGHAELTPRLRVRCRPANPGSDRLTLVVALHGPPELRRLDRLTVTIRDDNLWRQGTSIAGGPTPEQVAGQIWGPSSVRPRRGPGANPVRGVPGADPAGRTCPTRGLAVGEELPFSLEPTAPPSWSSQTSQGWRRERGAMLRLTFEFHQDGAEPWTLTSEIDTQTDKPVEVPAVGRTRK